MTCTPRSIYGGGVATQDVIQWLSASGFKPKGFRTPKSKDYYLYGLDAAHKLCIVHQAKDDLPESKWSPRIILEDIL